MDQIDYLAKFSLKKRNAFVTGGAGFLGSEISCALAVAGAQTIILDIDDEKGHALKDKIQANGHTAHYENFDITDIENSESNCQALLRKYKHMDVWVNSAYPQTKDWWNQRVEELSIESWTKNVDMNLNGTAWLNRAVALIMKSQGGGSIINIGSIYGVVGNDFTIYEDTQMMGSMPYSAIKGGIANMTRFMAAYFGPHKVRVNSVSPGGIENDYDPKFVRNYSHKTPLKRMGNPEEVASAVLFMASDASSYITGTNMMVDGGWTTV